MNTYLLCKQLMTDDHVPVVKFISSHFTKEVFHQLTTSTAKQCTMDLGKGNSIKKRIGIMSRLQNINRFDYEYR